MRPRILVVEDNAITAKMMRVALESSGFDVTVARDARAALRLIAEQVPALIVQDLQLPDMDGVALLERIRTIAGAEAIPVVVCSGLFDRMEQARSMQVSFSEYLFKPVDVRHLVQSVRKLLLAASERTETPGIGRVILLVDDDPIQTKLNALQLSALGFAVIQANNPDEAFAMAERHVPDAFVLDLLMPGETGLQLCLRLRRHASFASIPIVVTSSTFGAIAPEDVALAVRMGANALVPRTPSLDLVVHEVLKALDTGDIPPVSGNAEVLHEDFAARVGVQLEQQVAVSLSLTRRLALDSTLLAVTTGATALVNEQRDLDDLMHEVLARTLDAGGIASGAIFLRDEFGSLQLSAKLGFADYQTHSLRDFFGQMPLLERAVATREATHYTTRDFVAAGAGDFSAASGVSTLLLVPLIARSDVVGVLATGASMFEEVSEWIDTVRSIGNQLAQAIALSKTLDALTTSEEQFRSFVEGLPIGAYRSLPNGYLLDANPTFFRMFGYDSVDDMRRIDLKALFNDPLDRFQWQRRLDRDGVVHNFEVQMHRQDGEPLWISDTTRVVRGESGLTVRYEGALVDISERKRIEEQLSSSEAYFRQLFESNPLPMLVVDPESLIILASNAAASQYFEQPGADLTASTVDQLFESHDDPIGVISQVRNTEQPVIQAGASRFRHRSGKQAAMELTSRRIHFAGSAARLVIVHDITERLELQQQVVQAQKMEAVGMLAGGVAHDFNNLLTVMKTCSNMLLEELGPDDPRRESAVEIATAADRATVLTRQLLAFSRRQVLDPHPLRVNSVVTELEGMLRRLISANIELVLALDPDAGQVLADAGQIEQVIVNLVVNARDAMPFGGTVRITTSNVDAAEAPLSDEQAGRGVANPHVSLRVSDTGIGMDDATRARIFEPFFTTKPRGQGTGLGLATVYGIVRQSGGHIRVDSVIGAGTTFEILLPRVTGAAVPLARPMPLLESFCGSGCILLVEDEEAVRRIVANALRSLGYVVLEARNGEEALELMESATDAPDLLLTDVVMPRVSGYDLVVALRERWPALRVLFMSGYADVPGRHEDFKAHALFLQKPFKRSDLAFRVRQALAMDTR